MNFWFPLFFISTYLTCYQAAEILLSSEFSSGTQSGWIGDLEFLECVSGLLNFCNKAKKWARVKSNKISKQFIGVPIHYKLGVTIEAFIDNANDVNFLIDGNFISTLKVIPTNDWNIQFNNNGNTNLRYTLSNTLLQFKYLYLINGRFYEQNYQNYSSSFQIQQAEYSAKHETNTFTLDLRSNTEFYISSFEIFLTPCSGQCNSCTGGDASSCATCKPGGGAFLKTTGGCGCTNKYLDMSGNCGLQCPSGQKYEAPYKRCTFDNCSDQNFCLKCDTDVNCIQCAEKKVLYLGKCLDKCPMQSIQISSNCVHRALMDYSSPSTPVQYPIAYLSRRYYEDQFGVLTVGEQYLSVKANSTTTVNNLLNYFNCGSLRYYKGQEIGSSKYVFRISYLSENFDSITKVQVIFNFTTIDTHIDPLTNIKLYQANQSINVLPQVYYDITNVLQLIYLKEEDICYTTSNKEVYGALAFVVPLQPNSRQYTFKLEVDLSNTSSNKQNWSYMQSFGISSVGISLILSKPHACITNTCAGCTASSTYYYLRSKCYQYRCPMGGFNETGSYICKGCIENCQSCINTTECQECYFGYYYYNGICYNQSCPPGSYQTQFSTFQRICKQECPLGQALDSNENCISCDVNNGYTIKNHFCVPCTSQCISCNSEQQCLKCQSGYYISGNICVKCTMQFCQLCSQKGCSVCDSTMHAELDFKTEICVCQEGYFNNQASSQCEKCDSSCQQCQNSANQCTKCDSTKNLSLQNNQCLCKQDYEIDEDDITSCIPQLQLVSLQLNQKIINLVFNRALRVSEMSSVVVSAAGFDPTQLQFIIVQSKTSPKEVVVSIVFTDTPVIKKVIVKYKQKQISQDINYLPLEDNQKDQGSIKTNGSLNNIGSSFLDSQNPLIKYVIYPLKYLQLLTFFTNITQVYTAFILFRQYLPEEVYTMSYFTASLIFKSTPQYSDVTVSNDSSTTSTQNNDSSSGGSDSNSFQFSDLGIGYDLKQSCQFQCIIYFLLIGLFAFFYFAKKVNTEENYAQAIYSVLLNYFAGNIQGALIIVQFSIFYALKNPDKSSSEFITAVLFLVIQVVLFGVLFIYAFKKRYDSLINQFSNLVASLDVKNRFIRYYYPVLIIKKYMYGILAFCLMNTPKTFAIIGLVIFLLHGLVYIRVRFFLNKFFNIIKILQEILISILFILILVCITKRADLMNEQFIQQDKLQKFQGICKVTQWMMITVFVLSIVINIANYFYLIYNSIHKIIQNKKKKNDQLNELSFIKDQQTKIITLELEKEDNTFYTSFKSKTMTFKAIKRISKPDNSIKQKEQ